ncbi:MAG: hypothetical protein M0015_06140 [Betaproteobacteria bacterium]|nr:hypothetical protein [Betaproteobacteria bacterium]
MNLKRWAQAAVLGALLGIALAAQAQLRTIPPDAKRGAIRQVVDMVVEINGQRMQLAPGAQVRDPDNRIVLPAAIPPGALVKYKLDNLGMVSRVWILSPQEAAQPDAQR